MSCQTFGHSDCEDNSPGDSRLSKRRRIALACIDCRRRKLKCDHIFPACTRYQKRGHAASCTYDPDVVETIDAPALAEKASPAASPTSFIRHHALDTDDSAVASLRARIYRLENRINGIENIFQAPQRQYGSHRSTDSARRPKRYASIMTGREDPERKMFQGKGFNTQFYGASHPTSYLSYVRDLQDLLDLER